MLILSSRGTMKMVSHSLLLALSTLWMNCPISLAWSTTHPIVANNHNLRTTNQKKVTSLFASNTLTTTAINNNNVDDAYDDSFFMNASQQAAKDRMEQLRTGQQPLAVSLSSSSSTSTTNKPDVVQEEEKIKIPIEPQLKREAEIPPEPQSTEDDKTPPAVVQKIQSSVADGIPKTISVVEPMTDGITPEEAELVRNARLEGGGVQEEAEEGGTKHVTNATEVIGEGSTAEEAEEIRNARTMKKQKIKLIRTTEGTSIEGFVSKKEVNDTNTKTPVKKDVVGKQPTSSSQEVKVPIDPFKEKQRQKEMNSSSGDNDGLVERPVLKLTRSTSGGTCIDTTTSNEEENVGMKSDDNDDNTITTPTIEASSDKHDDDTVSGSTSTTKLSSDGKEIFEPGEGVGSEVNQENVDMALLVLTRSLFALKSIVDKE